MSARVVRIRSLVLALVVALVAAGCVSMPDSGPVVETKSKGKVSSESGTYIDPRPPQKGDTRTDVVRGFLAAMLATPIQTQTARKFLTEDAAAAWDPQHETITYAGKSPPRETRDGVVVTLDGPNMLDSRGAWRGSLAQGRRALTFPMALENGEWRIERAPDALIVPESWFEGRYQPVSLYFFDPTGTILAPEPVFVPRGEALATTLTQGLLLGPGVGLQRVIQSFIPRGLKVAVGVTVSDDGIADIPLTGDSGQLTPNTIELMMAQLAWTLRQAPEIAALRVSINGQPVPLPGGVSSYRVDGAVEFDPAGFQASPLLYGLRDGLLVSGPANNLDRVAGPLGMHDEGLRSIGVDLSARRVAGVSGTGGSVVVAPVSDTDGQSVRTVATGTDFLKPAWDFSDRLWLVDRTRNGARISVVDHNRLASLRVRGVTGRQVRMFLVSRDGTRFVAVIHDPAGDRLVVSRIEHSRNGRVLGATRARPISVEDEVRAPIRAIAWRTTTSIAVLSPFTPSLAQVRTAFVDGSPTSQDTASATVEGRLRALAGSPVDDASLYAVTRSTLIDVSSPDRRVTPLDDGVTTIVYVG